MWVDQRAMQQPAQGLVVQYLIAVEQQPRERVSVSKQGKDARSQMVRTWRSKKIPVDSQRVIAGAINHRSVPCM